MFGAENGSGDETILERRTHVVSIPGHECSNLAVPVSRGSRTACHQAGGGRNRSLASSGAGIAVASGSGRRAEYHGWHVGGRERNAGGEDRPHPVFQPNNDEVQRIQAPNHVRNVVSTFQSCPRRRTALLFSRMYRTCPQAEPRSVARSIPKGGASQDARRSRATSAKLPAGARRSPNAKLVREWMVLEAAVAHGPSSTRKRQVS